MPISITYNNDKIYNSIKVVNTDTGSYYKYVNLEDLYFTKEVPYEITYRLYSEMTSSTPFDIYVTASNSGGFTKTDIDGYLVDAVKVRLNTFTEKSHIITPQTDGTGSICLLLKYGTYYISEFKVKPYHTNNFSLGEMNLTIPSPPSKRTEPISVYPVYLGRNGKPVGLTDVTLVDGGMSGDFARYTIITGSNLVISHDDNLIEGSLFVGKNLRTGVEISGFDNAMIRSVGYTGFNNASQYGWSGFLIYSGTVLPGSGDDYRGVGLELHGGGDSGSLRYRVDDSGSFLEITGSIYATSGYFSGIVSASIGRFGGWTIDSHSFYSDMITMWSTQSNINSGSAIEFYDRINERTYLAISVAERDVTTFVVSESIFELSPGEFYTISNLVPVQNSYTTAYFTLGDTNVPGSGSSLIFDFASTQLNAGDFIVSGAKNIVFNLNCSGNVSINSPLAIDGKYGCGKIISNWEQTNIATEVAGHAKFTTPNSFYMKSTKGNNLWDGTQYTASDATIHAINDNFYGYASSSRYELAGDYINDIIHTGILGENSSRLGFGLKAGVYGKARGVVSAATFNVTHSNNGIAILGDALPGTNAWSGVFRFGKFAVGDPFNKFVSGSEYSSSIPETVLFVDAARMSGSHLSQTFGRVGINTYQPEYALHVSGSGNGSLGIIYASDDIIAFSDIRKKTNIQQIPGSIEKILNLTGVSFNIKNGTEDEETNTRPAEDNERRKIGLIAQDVEKVIPEVVYTDSMGYKSIAYANIVALLIEGIKEQNEKINQLSKEIDELKLKIQ